MTKEKKSLQEQLTYQKRLNHITNRIYSAKDTNDILVNLQADILGLLDAERITIYVVDPSKKQIVSKVKSGDEIKEIRILIGSGSIAGYCAAHRRVVNVVDAYDQNELQGITPPMTFDRSWDEKTGFRTNQVLAVPILHDKYLLGVIQLINKRNGRRFTAEDEASLRDVAEVLGIAFLKNQRVNQVDRPTRFEYLILTNILRAEELQEAMLRARQSKMAVESVLMRDFHVSRKDLGKSLSYFHGVPFIPFDPDMSLPASLFQGLKPSYLKSHGFVPIAHLENKVTVAVEDPRHLPARDAVRRVLTDYEVDYCVSLSEDIHKMIDLAFEKRLEAVPGRGAIEDILGRLQPIEETVEESLLAVSEEDSAIVQLVNTMVMDAFHKGASDIHIEPRQGRSHAVIRFRIDGACQTYQAIPHTHKRAMVSRIKIMADLDISERRLPQDGKILFGRFAPLDLELRVVTLPTVGHNEDVVIRLLPKGEPIPLNKMGMSDRDDHAFVELVSRPYGMVLVVGPTGSGKTTTLHAALAHINRPETKIWTAEDPVEITQEGLRQVQVLPKIGLDFPRAMRSFLRADPDVIMVGEMRDRETAAMAIEASLTGHLVLSTLHTNSAPETIVRLLDMGMDPFNFADSLLGILAQRLVRTLCPECKEPYHPSREEFDGLKRAYTGDFQTLGCIYNDRFALSRAKGCPTCAHTGYRGRAGLYELLAVSDTLRSLIQNRAKVDELRTQAIKEGMTTLFQDGIRKVCLGLTDMVQVRKVCVR